MSADEELVLLQVCAAPRFLSEIVPFVGLPERRCRELLQSLKRRKLVRLLHRRWTTTRLGEKYARQLLAEAQRKKDEAEARRRRIQERTAALGECLLPVQKEVQTAVEECREIPLASAQLRRLEAELESLRSIKQRLDETLTEEGLRELENVLEERLPQAAAITRQVRAEVASLGLFEVVCEPLVVDDPVWLLCTSCGLLQGQRPRFSPRYECMGCHREGRTFVPPEKSIQAYVAPARDRAKELDPRESFLRRLRKVLEIYRLPNPVAEEILEFFNQYPVTVEDLHFLCRARLGEAGTRLIVAHVFQIPLDYPSPWPSAAWTPPCT